MKIKMQRLIHSLNIAVLVSSLIILGLLWQVYQTASELRQYFRSVETRITRIEMDIAVLEQKTRKVRFQEKED